MNRVLDRSFVGERNFKIVVKLQERVFDSCRFTLLFNVGYIEVGISVFTGPRKRLLRKNHPIHTACDQIVVLIENQHFTVNKQLQFFHAFLLQRIEVFLVSFSNFGQYPNRGPDNRL